MLLDPLKQWLKNDLARKEKMKVSSIFCCSHNVFYLFRDIFFFFFLIYVLHNHAYKKEYLRYQIPKDWIFNRVISNISVELRETTLIISDSIETCSPVESEIVRVVSLCRTEMTEITRFKKENDLEGWIP